MTKHKWRHIVHLATDLNNDFLNYYNAIDYFGGDKRLEITKNHDLIKTKYCKEDTGFNWDS